MECQVSPNLEIMNANSPNPEHMKNLEIEEQKVVDTPTSPRKSIDTPTSPRKSENGSPEPNCAICLGKLENNSFTDSCFHQFCFTCLSEWSKVKAECPLCKQAFKSIIHNVRSIEDYDQYYIASKNGENGRFSEMIEGRRFRYPSTLTAERRRHLAIERSLEFYSQRLTTYASHFGGRPRVALHRLNETSEFRRHIYESKLWVRPQEDGRYRETSPEFYRENPACTHRLIPWLNRELVALMTNSDTQTAFVLELIMALISRYDINSAEFYEHIYPYFQDKTPQFIHEFFNYSRSAGDMTTYDRHAIYERLENRVSSDDSSPSSIVEVPVEGGLTDFDSPSAARRRRFRFRQKRKWGTSRIHGSRFSASTQTLPPPLDNEFIPIAGPSREQQTGSDILLLGSAGPSNRTATDLDSDSDCVVVECIPPRTPEVVDLLSESDEAPESSEAQPPTEVDDVETELVDVVEEEQSSSRLMRKNRCTYFFDYSSNESEWNDSDSDAWHRKMKIRSVIGSVKNLPPPSEPPTSEKHTGTGTSSTASSSRRKHKKHKKHKSKQKSSHSKHSDES